MNLRLGVWCDLITEGEYRTRLVEAVRSADVESTSVSSEDAVPCAFPGPGSPAQIQQRIDQEITHLSQSANFTGSEFVETDDGRRVVLGERGFGYSGRQNPWDHLCLEDIENDARDLFWMDEDDGFEDHCDDISDRLRTHGIHITGTELQELPYEVHFSTRLRARLQR